MQQNNQFNLTYLALVLQAIPIVLIGLHAGFWLSGTTIPNLTTTGLLAASAVVALAYMRETIRVLDRMKLRNDEQNVQRLEIILANTKLALLLNLVGALFLII